MEHSLSFEEFSPPDYTGWKKRVLKELGDKPFESLLVQSAEGLDLEPGYFFDHQGPALKITEEEKSFLFRSPASQWEIRVEASGTPEEVNQRLLEGLRGGADAIGFPVPHSLPELKQSLHGVLGDLISTHLIADSDPLRALALFGEWCHGRGYSTDALRGSLRFDTGASWEALKELAAKHKEWKNFRLVVIDAAHHREHGADLVTETAAALAEAHDVLDELTSNGVAVDDAAAMIGFHFGISTEYFSEIARLRAFRYLWKTVVEAYHPQYAHSRQAWIHSETSRFSLGSNDIHTNLLRLTTEAMSAVLGGSDSIHVLPCDAASGGHTLTAARWSRNIHHLLRDEAAMHEAVDAASGSFYLESLTGQIASKAWDLFLDIENRGGYRAAEGWLANQVRDRYSAIIADQQSGKLVRVGENKYVKQA